MGRYFKAVGYCLDLWADWAFDGSLWRAIWGGLLARPARYGPGDRAARCVDRPARWEPASANHPPQRGMPAALSGHFHQIWHGLLTGERMPIDEYWDPPQIVSGNAWSNVYPAPEKKKKKGKKKEPFGFYQRKKNPTPLSERGSFCLSAKP